MQFSESELKEMIHNPGPINLQKTDLSGAFLRGANLARVDLRGAYMENTILIRANLTFADLRDAYLESAQLDGAY